MMSEKREKTLIPFVSGRWIGGPGFLGSVEEVLLFIQNVGYIDSNQGLALNVKPKAAVEYG